MVEPTRKEGILDLVMYNESVLIWEFRMKEPEGDSDQSMIEFTLLFEREQLESDVTVIQWSRGNYRSMREEGP